MLFRSTNGYGWSEEVILTLDIEQLDKEELIVSGKMKYDWSEDGYNGSESYKVVYELEAK